MGEELKDILLGSTSLVERLYRYLEKENLLDSQEVLNWLDKLNEISVRH